jgi:hypothetical protein
MLEVEVGIEVVVGFGLGPDIGFGCCSIGAGGLFGGDYSEEKDRCSGGRGCSFDFGVVVGMGSGSHIYQGKVAEVVCFLEILSLPEFASAKGKKKR